MKKSLLLMIFLSLPTFAQIMEVPEYVNNRKAFGGPVSLPVNVDERGQLEVNQSAGTNFDFKPVLHGAFAQYRITYVAPMRDQEAFSLQEIDRSMNWLEVRSRRLEGGLGISATQVIKLGIVPFKGAYQIISRAKKTREEKLEKTSLPQTLNEILNWSVGDNGFYQTSGGIQAFASYGVGIISVASGSIGLQNQFVINLQRLDEDRVILTLSEEDSVRRQISVGPSIIEASVLQYKSKLFNAQFLLELNNPDHQKLYKRALKGYVTELQKNLPNESQSVTWSGSDKSLFVGIPLLLGQVKSSSTYKFIQNDAEETLDIKAKRTKGILAKKREHQKLLFQNVRTIILVWNSEMSKTKGQNLTKRFLEIGKQIGAQGFALSVDPQSKYGSMITNLAIGFTKFEFNDFKNLDLKSLAQNLQARCVALALECAQPKKSAKIVASLKQILSREWKDSRKDFGFLLMDQPVLIHSLLKTGNLDKSVYFKFLSESHQSMEGLAAIAP